MTDELYEEKEAKLDENVSTFDHLIMDKKNVKIN